MTQTKESFMIQDMKEKLDITSIQHIERVLAELRRKATQIDDKNRQEKRTLSDTWFNMSLFSQQSNLAVDYVAESETLFRQLKQSTNTQAQYYLAQKLGEQLEALNTRFRARHFPKEAPDQRLVAQNQLQQLHQQLVTYRGYERRLMDNVERAKDAHNTQHIQAAQQRLNRCQMAIDALEKKISRYEEG